MKHTVGHMHTNHILYVFGGNLSVRSWCFAVTWKETCQTTRYMLLKHKAVGRVDKDLLLFSKAAFQKPSEVHFLTLSVAAEVRDSRHLHFREQS